MFLSFLNQNERENFLELANFVAKSDDQYAESEKRWIKNFRNEMNLNDYQLQEKSFDEIMLEFDASSFVSKTSILLDIINLALADYNYEKEEQKIILNIRKRWNITDEQFHSIVFWLKDKAYILKAEEERAKNA